MNMKDLIWSMPKSLDSDFCNHVIKKFESDERKGPGEVFGEFKNRVNPYYKLSTDLHITSLNDWKDEDIIFYKFLHSGLEKYLNHCDTFLPELSSAFYEQTYDTGYQVQRTNPGGYYKWHHDWISDKHGSRVFTYIWYLNDISKKGETEFIDGTKIKPETGKLVIFPATWNYVHRGVSPKFETKYICTGWIYRRHFQ